MALAWSTCGGMAYYAVRRKQIQVHREWMVRICIVTFGFVTFRLLDGMGPTSRLRPPMEWADTFIWACWVLLLFAAEVVMQLRKIRELRPAWPASQNLSQPIIPDHPPASCALFRRQRGLDSIH